MEREIYDNMRSIERDHWWFKARRTILADQIARLGLSADAKILEVGCGTGGNLQMLANFGDVVGIEPDEASREYAENQTGNRVLIGTLPSNLPAFDTKFDLIAALDVLEHVDADAASVNSLAQLLRPGGRFLTTVPAHPWMWSRHDIAHHHKRRYRKRDYLSLFDKAQMNVLKASYFNTLLFPPIAFIRACHVLMRAEARGDDAMPPALLNSLLTKTFAFEKVLLRHLDLPIGVSILLIAERRI